jgi:hypothetical protein
MLTIEIGQASEQQIASEISRLAREASVEINVSDDKYLGESRNFLSPGTRIYVSHLPRQKWTATVRAC